MLLVEDVQWADPTSLRLLAFVGRRVRSARACLLITARLEDVEPAGVLATALSELRSEPQFSEVALAPLTRSDTVQMIAASDLRCER